ncbi:MAG: thiamine pyrophosphate-binding protein [Bacteroidales bacterium]|nr:thiamine pyrophosphate-binding protein [Bacteroidales bacterium]
MKLSDYIVRFFEDNEIDYIFGFIGGSITHLVDSISKSKKIKFIQVYHEQTASFAAEGFSRNSGKIGVAIATSGPGATNLITGIGDAFFDSVPVIFITGQVNTYEYKYDKPIRQQGFQETDIISVVKPITKYSALVDNPKKIKYELEKSCYIATHGRPGPVLLDIPMDIQRADIDIKQLEKFDVSYYKKKEQYSDIKKLITIADAIKNSKRPLILAGGGIRNSKAEKILLKTSENYSIPVVTSLMGKGVFPEDNNLFIGMIGSYGNRAANIIMSNSDLLIAVGSRLDTRQTGALLKGFLRSGKIIHVDIDVNEINNHRLKRDYKLCLDANVFLEKINSLLTGCKTKKDWLDYVKNTKNKYSQKNEVEKYVENKIPYKIMELLNKYSKKDQVFTVDIGQNQMFAAQMLKIKQNQKFFTSGGMAPMGYAIPVAIGSSFSYGNNKEITAITGDGGLHISLQSLMLLKQYNLPVKVIVLNNKSLGMIVQFQDLYFNKNAVGTTKNSGYMVPDIECISKAYELKYYVVNKKNINDEKYIHKIFSCRGPAIIEVLIENKTIVSPKLEVNSPIEDLNPKLSREELKKSMLIDLYEEKKDRKKDNEL